MPALTYTDLKAAILRRFINGETYSKVSKDYELATSKARDLARIFTTELWQYIVQRKIPHPYTVERYSHAYNGHDGRLKFLAYYLTPQDMREEKEFWLSLIDRVVSERGSVTRKLELTDAIERLELSGRATNCLNKEGVSTISDLLALIKDKTHWNNILYFGESSQKSVIEKLKHHGFTVENNVLLPTTIQLLTQALAFVRNPDSLSDQQRDELATQLQMKITHG